MASRQRFCYLLVALLFVAGAASGNAAELVVDPLQNRLMVSTHVDYTLHQPGLTVDQVRQLPSSHWQLNRGPSINFGPTRDAYWMRVQLNNPSNHQLERLLELSPPYLDVLDLYLYQNGNLWQQHLLGDLRPLSNRSVRTNVFLLPLQLPAHSNVELYLFVDSHGAPLHLSMQLWQALAFSLEKQGGRTFNVMCFGAAISLGIYNLFLFFATRQRAYFYYSVYVICFSYTLANITGFTQLYVFPQTPLFGQAVFFMTALWGRGAVYLFTLHFLELSHHLPLAARVFKGLFWLDACMFFACVVSLLLGYFDGLALIYSSLFNLFLIPVVACLPVGLLLFVRGVKAARFYVVGWLIYACGYLLYYASLSGIIPYTTEMTYTIQLSQLLEMLLLSFALADRLNMAREDQQKTIDMGREAKRTQALAIQEQARAMATIKENLALKNAFLTAISHELRTPMNAILGGLQVAQQHSLEHLKSPLDIVQSGAAEMMRLVNDILCYTEIQSGRVSNHRNDRDIQRLFLDLHQRYQVLCDAKQLRLQWCVAPSLPCWLQLDAEKLDTVLSKLLDNALKFTHQGSVILRVDYESEHLIFEVEDTGIGIAPQQQALIFEAFRQEQWDFQRRYAGLGIGLAICHQLLKLIHGEITLLSSSDQGSCFRVTILAPLGQAPVAMSGCNKASAKLPILVVEDNLTNQLVLQKMLKKLGYTSRIAGHGQAALAMLEQQSFSIVLMDLQMPVMDGFVCTATIRQRADEVADIPIIAVTANLMDTDKSNCIDLGMNDFLKKPVRLEGLQRSLSRFVEPSAD